MSHLLQHLGAGAAGGGGVDHDAPAPGDVGQEEAAGAGVLPPRRPGRHQAVHGTLHAGRHKAFRFSLGKNFGDFWGDF